MSPGGAADLLAATIFVPHGNLDGTFEKYNIIKIYDAVIDLKMYGRS